MTHPPRYQSDCLRSYALPALNSQQRRFVEEYLVDLSARAAAERAGYNAAVGYRLLRRPEVAKAVAEAKAARAHRLRITADNVVAEIAAIAFSDIRKVVRWDFSEHSGFDPCGPPTRRYSVELRASHLLDVQTSAAIAEFHRYATGAVRVRMHDKLSALAMLGRHLGVSPGFAPARGPRPNEADPELELVLEPAPTRLTHEQGLELHSAMTTILRVAPQMLIAADDDADT